MGVSASRLNMGLVGVLLLICGGAALQTAQLPAAPATNAARLDEPAIPPGVSEFDIEVFAQYAYTWPRADGTQVIECLGEFELRMGTYALHSRDAVVWFRRVPWRDRAYYDVQVFLYREAEIRQPAGTIESGEALIASLRSFGKLVLSADGHAPQADEGSELYRAAITARGGASSGPAEPDIAETPVQSLPPAVTALTPPKVPKAVAYRSDELSSMVREGRRIVVAIGNVYASQGSADSGDFLELRADNAVLYMKEGMLSDAPGSGATKSPETKSDDKPDALPGPGEERLTDEKPKGPAAAGEYVEAVYLEGDVVLTRGTRMIRATKLYYDFESERALILDAVMRALEDKSNVPVYVRAAEVRQLSATEFKAVRPVISNSEFHTPHASLGAAEATLTDRTPRDETGEIAGVQAGGYEAKHTTLNLEGVPLAYWPVSKGEFSTDQTAFKSMRAGHTSRLGATIETRWHAFNLLGLEKPQGYDATLHVDEFTRKGPAIGLDLDYAREDYYGLFRGYYLNDHGEDRLGGNPTRGGPPDTENRGRALWRHRQFLGEGWELTLETSYISDNQYLEAYERNEFENGKAQESVAYLLKRQRNWQFSLLSNVTMNDFVTLTEHYPEARFSLIGEPLGEYATFYHDSRMGVTRYNLDNDAKTDLRPPNERGSGTIFRGDSREELTVRLPDLGPLKLTPFVSGRGSAWDDTPDDSYIWRGSNGGQGRLFGTYGLRGNMYLQRTYEDIESRLLDLHRLRHILKPEFAVWNAHTNVNSNELFPLDPDVEGIDDFGGGMVGLRQRWQTQRGGPGRWRTVDWIVLDVKAAFFSNSRPRDNTHGNYVSQRPEDSISSNYLSADFLYRISDTTAVIYDGVYDFNRGNAGVSNVSLAFERLPRLSTFVGWRYIHDTGNNLVGFGGNYKLSEKHTLGLREYYDIDLGRNGETQLIYVRRWPRWYTAVSIEWDRALNDFSVSMSIWPEGTSNVALGSKRYTSLGDSVGLRP